MKISHLFLLLCLVVAGILGSQAISAYVTYLSLKETARTVIRNVAVNPHKADEANAQIAAKAEELEIPFQEDQTFIQVYETKVQARIIWQHSIGFGGFTFPLTFEVDESEDFH